MLTRNEYLEFHWTPYMLTEGDLLDILDFVSLRECNYKTCSERIIRVHLGACEQLEALMKSLYGLDGRNTTYADYADCIEGDERFNTSARVELLRGLERRPLVPFAGLSRNKAPTWWSDHNKIKHDRARYFELGTLENALTSMAALYYVNLLFAKVLGDYWLEQPGDKSSDNRIDVPDDISRLFETAAVNTRFSVHGPLSYSLPDNEFIEYVMGKERD